jgi:hypothetical protein
VAQITTVGDARMTFAGDAQMTAANYGAGPGAA